jgi:hypothetical protein
LRTKLESQAYSWQPTGFGKPPWFDLWEHPLLESTEASHFTDSLFGALNTLKLLGSASAGSSVLSFCSKRQVPGIEGELDIGPDTTIRSASWVFRTPPPVEEAGGRVVFAAPDSLLPDFARAVVGVFWRKRVFDYLQMWWEFRGWVVVNR